MAGDLLSAKKSRHTRCRLTTERDSLVAKATRNDRDCHTFQVLAMTKRYMPF
jgi:hypothetical protein